eukprot:5866437-Pyramimonas_sp.AAC.1
MTPQKSETGRIRCRDLADYLNWLRQHTLSKRLVCNQGSYGDAGHFFQWDCRPIAADSRALSSSDSRASSSTPAPATTPT